MKGHEFQNEYTLGYFDVDKNQNLKIPTLIDMCNNTSTMQSESLDMGLSFLEKHSAAWIFCKIRVELTQIPKFKDTIIVKTYAVGFKRYFASRKFEILNSAGEQIGLVQGLYCLIDTNTRRPMVIPEDHVAAYGATDETILLRDLRMKALPQYDYNEGFKVRYFNIDTNGHTNSGVYPMWALESLPLEYHDNKKLKQMDIIFEKEVLIGEEVTVKTKLENNTATQAMFNSDNNTTTLIQSIWEDL